jgi:hypothetical protein
VIDHARDSTIPARGPWSEHIAALMLIGAPLLGILGMAHHPSVHAHGAAELAAGLKRSAELAALVHGFLIAVLIATLWALTEFSVWRGLRRALVRLALLTYGVGVLLMVCAALVSGLVTPRIAEAATDLMAPELQWVARLAAVAMLFNQAFARCGAVLMSVGICSWSMDLLRDRAVLLGAFGTLCGLGCALAVGLGLLRLDVHGMMTVTVLQAIWTIGAGWRFIGTTRTDTLHRSG